MFTGIINHIGDIIAAQQKGDLTITVACDFNEASLVIGESIACNGACLTVISKGPHDKGSIFTAELSGETLACTAPRWNVGDRLHLERALKLGDALDGHMVTGHVDGTATITSITLEGDSHRVEIEAPEAFSRFIAAKGSVTLDGISLTVNPVDGNRFGVNIIPHTWQATTLGSRKVGDLLNIEIDLIARYTARLLNQ
jgi:riboflavin synthase